MMGRLIMPVERSSWLMFLIFRNDMTRDCFVLESDRFKSNVMSLWSVMMGGRLIAEQFPGMTPEQQTISRVWPFECVGKLTYCFSPKLSRQKLKSLVNERLLLSM